jgi:acetyl esterase
MAEPIVRSERLHPELRTLLEAMDAQPAPSLAGQDPATARIGRLDWMKTLGGDPVALGRVENLNIPGTGGDVPVRVYANEDGGDHPALIYFHGGGFVFGNLDTHDTMCRALARQSDAVVIAVDYRLSPEHKFPAAVEDAYAATLWAAENSERLGIDASRIAVGGDSAGGNLAAVVAMRCRDAGGPPLALQVLIYPITDFSSFETGSYRECGEGYFLTRATMEWLKLHYLEFDSLGHHPEVSPMHAPDLSGLPPAFVITAEFDPLRDEGEAYAQRLQRARVPVTVTRYPGMVHGFFSMSGLLADGRKAMGEVAARLQSIAG